MESLKIDRSRWLVGTNLYNDDNPPAEGEEWKANSYLLRPEDGKMCCLGFVARDLLNLSENDLRANECPVSNDYIARAFLNHPTLKNLVESAEVEDQTGETRHVFENSELGTKLMVINDDGDSNVEEILKEEFKKLNIDVEFIGEWPV